jgi:CYTH domain-containing protein
MEPIHGGETIFKLGQKDAPVPPDFSRTTITNIYLSPNEYAVLSELDAHELHKVRHAVEYEGRIFSVDVFDFPLAGLVLAEVSFESVEEMDEKIGLPPWIGSEVSTDLRFTGGALATLTADQAAELTREIVTPA